MPSITLTAVVDENGHLEVDVPLPPGPVEVVIRPVAENGEAPQPGTHEWARAKLIAAGHLNPNARYAPPTPKHYPRRKKNAWDDCLPQIAVSRMR